MILWVNLGERRWVSDIGLDQQVLVTGELGHGPLGNLKVFVVVNDNPCTQFAITMRNGVSHPTSRIHREDRCFPDSLRSNQRRTLMCFQQQQESCPTDQDDVSRLRWLH
jgi:hypothetical protein